MYFDFSPICDLKAPIFFKQKELMRFCLHFSSNPMPEFTTKMKEIFSF